MGSLAKTQRREGYSAFSAVNPDGGRVNSCAFVSGRDNLSLRMKTNPPSMADIKSSLREVMPALDRDYGVISFQVFGSFVRGQEDPGSDLDVLVDFRAPISLLRFIELEQRLSDQLGVRVDLVMRDALKPSIGRSILAEAQPI